MRFCHFATGIIGLSGFGSAQDAPTATLRLLPLGELPPFRQEIRDGVRRELDPPVGSIPPRVLEAGLPSESDMEVKPPAFLVQLSMTTPSARVFPSEGLVKLRQPDGEVWLEVPCPAGSRTLAVLWRPGDTWQKPQVLALPDLEPDHDPREFRFVNVAPQVVGIVFGDRRYQLASGKSVSLTLPAGSGGASVAILFADAGGALKPCFSAIAEPRDGMATQYFIHRSDGEAPRRPVTVTPITSQLTPP